MKTNLHNKTNVYSSTNGLAFKVFISILFCLASLFSKALTRTWIGFGAGGTAARTDIAAAANWSGGTPLLATDDYVMTFSGTLGSNGTTATFTLTQSAALTFKSLTVSFNGNGNGLKKVIINTSFNLIVTNAFGITNSSNSGFANHEIAFNVTAGTFTCGSANLVASGPGGFLFGIPQLYLRVNAAASMIVNAAFVANCPLNSWTSTFVENNGTITINGSTSANSAGNTQILFDANNGGVFNMNGAVALGTSGSTGVFLSTFSPGTSTGKFYFRNNLTFGSLGFVDPSYNPQSYTFDGVGNQTLSIGNPNVYFSNLIIGEINSPTVNVTGGQNGSLTGAAASANLLVNNSSVLNLSTRTLNRTVNGGSFSLNQSATIKLAGTTAGQTGSNFPKNFNVVNLNINSTVEYNAANGTTQTVYAVPTYGLLTLTNGSGIGSASKNISANVVIAHTLTLNDRISFTIPSTRTVTLKSDATTTARVNEIVTPATVNVIYGGSGATKGKFIVERYISAVKGWRFLAVPTNSSEFIHAAWQEGQVANSTSLAGKGVQITSNAFPNGFDLFSSVSSIRTFVPATGTWTGVASTLAPFDNSKGGYMTFIRGDRTVNSYGQAPTATVLRSSGDIYIGDRPYTVTGANQFAAISNPYASAIDFTKFFAGSTGINEQFYIYDPKAGTPGIGGYQTIVKVAGVWKAIPGGGSYPAAGPVNPYIQSGQAFLVYSTTGTGSFSITENAKVGGSNLVSRNTGIHNPVSGLFTSIYVVNADGSRTLLDGAYNDINERYSNVIDRLDARKTSNFGMNLSIRKNSGLLVVDRCKPFMETDTIFLNLTGAKIQQYQFEFAAENFYSNDMLAYLEDNFLHTRTAILATENKLLNFSIANVPGSYASDRFRIIFVRKFETIPTSKINIESIRNSLNGIVFDWKTINELNIDHYEIERSEDGINFSDIHLMVQNSNDGLMKGYTSIDRDPTASDNYYRVKSVSKNGKVQYSNIAKITTLAENKTISVYPNPVENKMIKIHFEDGQSGEFSLQLSNAAGQVVYIGKVTVTESDKLKTVHVGENIASGNYLLSISSMDGKITSAKLFIK